MRIRFPKVFLMEWLPYKNVHAQYFGSHPRFKSDYKWKSLLSGQQNKQTQIAHGMFSQNNIASGLQHPGSAKQNKKKCAESRSVNPNAGKGLTHIFGWKGEPITKRPE